MRAALNFASDSTSLVITGKTFYVKEQIKILGGRWNEGRWVLPLNSDSPLMRSNLLEQCRLGILLEKAKKAEEQEKRVKYAAYLHSPEFVKDALAAKAAGSHEYFWICCEKCRVLDAAKQTVWCNGCGADYGTHIEGYFVRGRLCTGD